MSPNDSSDAYEGRRDVKTVESSSIRIGSRESQSHCLARHLVLFLQKNYGNQKVLIPVKKP